MNINDIFTLQEYDEAYDFVSTHEQTFIEDLGDGKYQILEIPKPSEEEIAQKEAERIARLHLTKREVFLGLYKAAGLEPHQIRERITDPEAKIEFDYATEYYRGNPLIDEIGKLIGFTKEQLDKFFETNDYQCLIG